MKLDVILFFPGWYNRYEFRASAQDHNNLDVSVDIQVTDSDENVNGTYRDVTFYVDVDGTEIWNQTDNIMVKRDGAEVARVQAFTWTDPVLSVMTERMSGSV